MGKHKNKNNRKRQKHAKEKEDQYKLDGHPKKELKNSNTIELSSTESEDQHVRENWDDDNENWEIVTHQKKKPHIKNETPKNNEIHPKNKEVVDEKPVDKNIGKSKQQKDDNGPDQDMECEEQEEALPNLGQPLAHRKKDQRERNQNCSSQGGNDSRNRGRSRSAHRPDYKPLHIKNKTSENDQNHSKSQTVMDKKPPNRTPRRSKNQNDDINPDQDMERGEQEEALLNPAQPIPHGKKSQQESNQKVRDDSRNRDRSHSVHRPDNKPQHIKNKTLENDQNHRKSQTAMDKKHSNRNKRRSKKQNDNIGADQEMEWESPKNQRERKQNFSSRGRDDSRNHSQHFSADRRDNSTADNRNTSFSDRTNYSKKQDQDPSYQKDNNCHRYNNDSKKNYNNKHSSRNYPGNRNDNWNRSSYGAAGDLYPNGKEAQTRDNFGRHEMHPGPSNLQYRETNWRSRGRLNTRCDKPNQFYQLGNDNAKPKNLPKKKQKQPLFVPNAEKYEPTIREIEGDLFDSSEEYSLAHCVAEDFSMGAGIAIEFKKRFKGVEQLLQQNKKTGEVAILKKDNRIIFYIITKTRSNGKPTIDSFTSAIKYLKQVCVEHNVKKLAIPRIGSGLDRLDWGEVKDVLYEEFSSTDIEIVVYVL